jgi:hypothetical protein
VEAAARSQSVDMAEGGTACGWGGLWGVPNTEWLTSDSGECMLRWETRGDDGRPMDEAREAAAAASMLAVGPPELHSGGLIMPDDGGFILFSFCRLQQEVGIQGLVCGCQRHA